VQADGTSVFIDSDLDDHEDVEDDFLNPSLARAAAINANAIKAEKEFLSCNDFQQFLSEAWPDEQQLRGQDEDSEEESEEETQEKQEMEETEEKEEMEKTEKTKETEEIEKTEETYNDRRNSLIDHWTYYYENGQIRNI
jgi:flagellar biosynthesis GTPase FlhF